MWKNLINIFLIIFVYSICCIFIYNANQDHSTVITKKNKLKSAHATSDVLATIKIDKIGIDHPIYPLTNPKNNVDQNISILKGSILPDQDNSIMFIAAHSGVGKIAYFNNLDKLNKGDKVSFFYKNKEYKYIVSSMYEEKKDGYIHVSKGKDKQLVLTTCSKNKGKQLVVNCILT